MKEQETRLAFIKARAEGKSYSTITKELGISKATCSTWERDLKADIDGLKQAQLDELYTAYNMKRDARIKALGQIIERIDQAIANKPLEDLPADKLLELRLKYGRELKEEYTEPVDLEADNTLDGLLEQYNQIYTDSRKGDYTPADIKAQLSILDAKRDTMYRIISERSREEESPFSFNMDAEYKSDLIRHNNDY